MTTATRRPTTNATEPDWQRGACTNTRTDLFFPIGDSEGARRQNDQAKLMCARCPIQPSCLSWALEAGEDQGVWGGLTEKERQYVRREGSLSSWGRTRNVAERIYVTRLSEFTGLVDQGLKPTAIAAAMATNVQTVNRVMAKIAEAKQAGLVMV